MFSFPEIRRGTDIFKALALGAKAVGLGRYLFDLDQFSCHEDEILRPKHSRVVGDQIVRGQYIESQVRRGATDAFGLKCADCVDGKRLSPMIFSMAAYGKEGIVRCVDLLKEELEMAMRLMGTPTLKDIKPEMIITRNLADHIEGQPRNFLHEKNYERMGPAWSKL